VDVEFLKELLRRGCLASSYQAIPDCEWDAKTRVLTTPADAAEDALASNLKSQPWFMGLAEAMGNKDSTKSKPVNPDFAFKLSSSRSVQTIHGEHDGKYGQAVGKDIIELDQVRAVKSNGQAGAKATADDDELSNLSNLSKGELMDYVRKIKSKDRDQPSLKRAGTKSSQYDSSDDEASSSDESSSDDDSSSESSAASNASVASQKKNGAASGA
jgi:hypothetical protein